MTRVALSGRSPSLIGIAPGPTRQPSVYDSARYSVPHYSGCSGIEGVFKDKLPKRWEWFPPRCLPPHLEERGQLYVRQPATIC